MNEVTKLKLELEKSHHEIHNLKDYSENLRKTLEENKIITEMFMQKTQEFEPKYYEKRDALQKLELQYKMEESLNDIAQNNTLREDFQKIAMEKSQLIRKIDVLEEKEKRDLMFSKDITKKLAQLKSAVVIIKSDIQDVKEDQKHVAIISQVDLASESTKKCQELSNIITNLKVEKDVMEEEFIKYKAKSDKLESFISANNRIFQEDNLEARVLLTQYKKMSAHYKQKIETKNEIITTLNDNLCREKETNMKLIKGTDDKAKHIAALEKIIKESKLADAGKVSDLLQESVDQATVKLENEIVEIEDSQ